MEALLANRDYRAGCSVDLDW